MELFLIGIPCAFILPLICKFIFPHEVTVKEYLLVSFINVVCVTVFYFLINLHATWDTEIWSGQVTSKQSQRVSCEHSYQCNCRQQRSGSDSKGNATYTTVCDTCYDHSYDVDWQVDSNVGRELINRVDRQGVKQPPRFSKVEVGEPFATTRSFTNYIKAAPDTLFVESKAMQEKYVGKLPAYPEIYDYYRINRVITLGQVGVPANDLNIMLNEQMRKWGPLKQGNVIAVFVDDTYQEDFYHALQSYWLGGKKNDIIVIVQVDSTGKVGWNRVFSRADTATFDKSIEFDIATMKQFDARQYVNILNENIGERFHRLDFEQFKYLLEELKPSTTALIVGVLFALIINIGLNFLIVKEDLFGDGFRKRFR